MDDDEYSKLLTTVMKMQAEFWKNAPRVVYDHKNDNIDVRCGDSFVWGDKNAK